jgi:crossover junction endodeoxyribonuclease RuvC
MRVLGIDPGTLVTGWGLIDENAGRLVHIDNGGIFPPKGLAFSDRIYHIFQQVEFLLERHKPDAVALENIFVAKNVSSTLKLGHARGAVMVAASRAKAELFEYSANQVKSAITGYGHAGKEQIQKMVKSLLNLPAPAFADASDALAVAICHTHSFRLAKKVGNL